MASFVLLVRILAITTLVTVTTRPVASSWSNAKRTNNLPGGPEGPTGERLGLMRCSANWTPRGREWPRERVPRGGLLQ